MGNEKKPKKKKRLSEAGVIIIGALVGIIPCGVMLYFVYHVCRLIFSNIFF